MANSLGCLTIVVAMLIATCESRAQVAPLIANIGGLATTNLNGQWQAIVDPYEVGFLDYRAYPLKDNNAFFKNYKPKSKSELVEI
jgi:beta-glucuronidase